MKERYDIKGKIGQGGIGAVYRAFDRRLNRDVAIKRVLPQGGFENQEEAVAHLLKEAKSLSSVQHPHIVTVYDAGVDEEGPYVVMELLAGRTLDEMVERGSLTQEDFREVAVQTQEALIAAQELDLVHRDLKPTNVMVTWLPSGKFQMKLVDFGLAKFSPKPSLQTIDHGDAVFGSIHFMAPEQFERTPLDQRTDMYSMGCMYYFSLTGIYPFGGETAPEVMASHLRHRVTPLPELRPDLPSWLTEWVMWHIEREMDKRPSNARESLNKFLMTEKQNSENPAESGPAQPKRPKLVFPGAETPPATPIIPAEPDAGSSAEAPEEVPTGTAPQPIQPPEGPPAGQTPPEPPTPPADAPPPAPEQAPPPPPATPAEVSAPVPVSPPTDGAPPAPPASAPPEPPAAVPPPAPAAPPAAVAAPAPTQKPGQINFGSAPPPAAPPADPAAPAPGNPPTAAAPSPAQPSTFISGSTQTAKRKGMSNAAKITIAAVLVVAVFFVGLVVIGKGKENKEIARLNTLLAEVEDVGAKDLPTTADDAQILLRAGVDLKATGKREAIYQRLLVAKGDGTDLDKLIAEFATNEDNDMSTDIRIKFLQVVQGRRSPTALEYLIEHARNASKPETASAALKAAEKLSSDENVPALLSIIQFTAHEDVRQSAKRTVVSLAERSETRESLAAAIKTAHDAATTDKARLVFIELLGSGGGDAASTVVEEALKSTDLKTRLAGIAALGSWADDSEFDTLLDHMAEEENDTLRDRAFDSAYQFLMNGRERDEIDLEDMWKSLAAEAKTRDEKVQILNGLAKLIEDWAFAVVEFFVEDKDDRVSYRAEQALEVMEERRQRLNPDGNADEDEDEDDE